ncbi:hypothetical protein [Ruegeria atlantica]|uniref:hypothetical protein n=1 Tax=Ruegeria atlantica TaxID=81569 RepID=UPI00147A062B|nr:hypothetical protein [Ruegeria atlantica]
MKVRKPDEPISRLSLTYSAYADVQVNFGEGVKVDFFEVPVFDFCEHLLFKVSDICQSLNGSESLTNPIYFSDPNDLESFALTPKEKGTFVLTYPAQKEAATEVTTQYFVDSTLDLCARTILDFGYHSGVIPKDISKLFVPPSLLEKIDTLIDEYPAPNLEKLSLQSPPSSGGWIIES